MNDTDHARLKELFIAACDLPPDAQAALLDEECSDDPALRAELRRLLRMDSDPSGVLAGDKLGVAFGANGAGRDDALPERVGQYRPTRRIGVGGMGVVWLAEQDHPRRTVALKVMHAGIVSPDLLRRFEFETSVLARLKHPGIAQIYDAGTFDEDGAARPYFAMEHVDGIPLNEHIVTKRPSLEERLRLFIAICDAVQHAHQKGVVHRDLKPANILVTADGRPKVLDFGVARATDVDLRATLQTMPGQLVGTLAYMSPEQIDASEAGVDVRCDVYALGVNLYEMLAGRLPYDLGDKGIARAAKVITEQEPAPLSAVDRAYRGDLNTIALKALEKNPAQRYQSASDLAADVRRFLNDDPILARPATTVYQLYKFARRNRGLVVGASTTLMVLVAGAAVATVFAVGQSRALAESEHQRNAVVAINDFLTEDLLEAADPTAQPNREITLRESLDRAAERIDGRFDDEPLIEASIRMTVGKAYRHLAEYELADQHLSRAYELYRSERGELDEDALLCRMELGALLIDRGELDQAKAEFEAMLDAQRKVLGEDHEQTIASLHNLGVILLDQGKFAEAERYFDETLEKRLRVLGENDTHTATTMNNLAVIYQYTERFDKARDMFTRALAIHRKVSGPEHPETLRTMVNLGAVHHRLGEYEEAAAIFEEALEIHRRVFGEEHPSTLHVASSLAVVYGALGKNDEREALLRSTLAIQERVLGASSFPTLATKMNLAKVSYDRGDYEQAEQEYAAVADGMARAAPNHFLGGIARVMHGRCLIKLERFDEAEEALLAAHTMFNDQFGPDDSRTKQAVSVLVELYEQSGNAEELAKWQDAPAPPDDGADH